MMEYWKNGIMCHKPLTSVFGPAFHYSPPPADERGELTFIGIVYRLQQADRKIYHDNICAHYQR